MNKEDFAELERLYGEIQTAGFAKKIRDWHNQKIIRLLEEVKKLQITAGGYDSWGEGKEWESTIGDEYGKEIDTISSRYKENK